MKNTIQSSNAILEFNNLSKNNTYAVTKINLWIYKYEFVYNQAITSIRSKNSFPRLLEQNRQAYEFIDFYELLKKISLCSENEMFFKEQLSIYDKIKNNVTKLNNWLNIQHQDNEKKQNLFNDVFYDNRELTDYNFTISSSLIIDHLEFKYSLQYLRLLKKANMIEIIGEVKQINKVEIFEQKNKFSSTSCLITPKYTKQKILIATKDVHHNIFQITFLNGKTALINNVFLGQKVKIYVDLRGGYIQKGERKDYYTNPLGWDLEILE